MNAKKGTKKATPSKGSAEKKGATKRPALPEIENSLLLRADFTDESAWKKLSAAVKKPVGEFQADVTALSNPAYDGVTVKEILKLAAGAELPYVFLADRAALEDPEQAVLVIDLEDKPGRTFRVIPSEAWSVENNLSLCNMEFDEFAGAVDAKGVFRGFPDT